MVATDEKLIEVVTKSASQRQASKKLGLTPAAVSKRLKENPHLKEKIQDIRLQAIKKSGLSLVKAFKRVNEALDAKQYTTFGKKTASPDHDIRLKAAKQTAEIHHVTKEQGESEVGRPIVVMPVVVINGQALTFKVGQNG